MGVKGCDLLVVWFVGSTWKVGECILVTGDIYTHFIHEAKRQDPYVLLKLSCHAHPEIVCNSDKEVTSLSQQWRLLLLSTLLIKIYLEVCLRDSRM